MLLALLHAVDLAELPEREHVALATPILAALLDEERKERARARRRS